jgi:hypothetical protein
MRTPPKKTLGKTEMTVFLLCFLIGLASVWLVVWNSPAFGPEAIQRAGVGQDLLAGLTRGRQGFVGSLRHAPLPTLLALPFLKIPVIGGPWALVLIALLSSAFLGALISAWLRNCGLTALTRITVALSVTASPLMMREVMKGSSEPLFALLVFSAFCLLLHWWRTDQLRSLAYLAIVTALALLTRYQAVVLMSVIAGFVLVHLIQRRKSESYAEATLIVLLIPSLYVAGLWVIANWLIMGEPFFFLRGLRNTTGESRFIINLMREGCLWLLVVLTCGVAVVGRMTTFVQSYRLRPIAYLATLAFCFLFWNHAEGSWRYSPTPTEAELAQVTAEFRASYAEDWIIVSGYRGYDVAREAPDLFLHHTLSLYRGLMLRQTKGKRSYLLVPLPSGCDRWEDVHLQSPTLYDDGADDLVYEKTWRYWRLWRIVRMDETDRK